MTLRRLLGGSLVVIALGAVRSLAGCDNTPACIPGQPDAGCTCNTGAAGYVVCNSDGLSYGSCICGSPDGATNGGQTDGSQESGPEVVPSDGGGSALMDASSSTDAVVHEASGESG